jgi:hypothetical protein
MDNAGSILLFCLAAVSGVALLIYANKNNCSPIPLVAIHGLLFGAAHAVHTAEIASEVRAYQMGELTRYPLESYAFVLFSFALLVGLYMLVKGKLLRRHVEKIAIFSYAGLGILGFVILTVVSITGV